MTLVSLAVVLCAMAQPKWTATIVSRPSNDLLNSYYQTNQQPLIPQHLVKLPVGAIKPGGWLLKSLELQRDGLTGQLGEISSWLTKKNNEIGRAHV